MKVVSLSVLRIGRLYAPGQSFGRARAERDGTRADTRFRLSPKRTSPFTSVGASVQSTAGSRGVRISFSNAGYTTFWGGVRVLATYSICHFPLHFPSRASPCAIRFRTSSTSQAFCDFCEEKKWPVMFVVPLTMSANIVTQTAWIIVSACLRSDTVHIMSVHIKMCTWIGSGPASWSSGQIFWLLSTRSWVWFQALPWEFSL